MEGCEATTQRVAGVRRPSPQELAEWREHAEARPDDLTARRLLVLLDLLEPRPVTQCPSRPKVAGQVLGCEPDRTRRGRCMWCRQPPEKGAMR